MVQSENATEPYAQYAAGVFLLNSLPSACIHSMRAMVIKQGVTVTRCLMLLATPAAFITAIGCCMTGVA